MSGIDRVLRGFALAAAIVAGMVILAMTLLISLEVTQRSLFNHSFLFVEEYSGYMVLAVLAFGVPLALMDDALLRVDLLIDRVKRGKRRWLQVVYDAASLVFSLIATYHFTAFAYGSYSNGTFAPTPMMTPLYIPQSIIAVGFTMLSICLAWRIIAGALGTGEDARESPEGSDDR